MRDAAVVLEHHALHVLRYHRNLGIDAGKFADRIERAPARDDEELDATLDRAPQDAGVDEAGDACELRKSVAAQVLDVFIRALRAREAAPLPGDQIFSARCTPGRAPVSLPQRSRFPMPATSSAKAPLVRQ